MHDRHSAGDMLTKCPELLHVQDSVGEIVLHYCAIEGKVDAVDWLRQQGAPIDMADNSHTTPLIYAALGGCRPVVHQLLEGGANLNKTSVIWGTALHAAASHGYADICEVLLKAGASVNIPDDCGQHPWDVALPRKAAAVRLVLAAFGGKPAFQD